MGKFIMKTTKIVIGLGLLCAVAGSALASEGVAPHYGAPVKTNGSNGTGFMVENDSDQTYWVNINHTGVKELGPRGSGYSQLSLDPGTFNWPVTEDRKMTNAYDSYNNTLEATEDGPYIYLTNPYIPQSVTAPAAAKQLQANAKIQK